MGRPADLTEKPLTEADVRRIVMEVTEPMRRLLTEQRVSVECRLLKRLEEYLLSEPPNARRDDLLRELDFLLR